MVRLKMRLWTFIFIVFWMFPKGVDAQAICGLELPSIKLRMMATEDQKSALQTLSQIRRLDTLLIPVVVHVVYYSEEENISDEKIYEQINILNKAFGGQIQVPPGTPAWVEALAAPTGIQFCLAQRDANNQPTNGITRSQTDEPSIGLKTDSNGKLRLFYDELGGKTPWDTQSFFNIYICDIGSTIAGYASSPERSIHPNEDGAVVNYRFWGVNSSENYPNGYIACHETGHYFNLLHPWGRGGCESDDKVRDTPRQDQPTIGCPDTQPVSCESEDLVHNFMDYTDDPCVFMFTQGQVLRMQHSLAMHRPGLLRKNCEGQSIETSLTPQLYPNPVKQGPIVIRWPSTDQNTTEIQVWSTDGRLLNQTKHPPSTIYSITCETWPQGIYVIRCQTSQNIHTFKVLKLD
jgi:hypothetical protein